MKRKLFTALLCAAMVLGGSTWGNGSVHTVFAASEGEGVAVGGRPTPVNMTPQEENNYPYMGASLRMTEKLLNAVLDNRVFMLADENVEYTDLGGNAVSVDWRPTAEHTVIHQGSLEFMFLPEGMRERAPYMGMENPMTYEEFEQWITEAQHMARFELYRKGEFQEALLEESGYEEHRRLGENSEFIYYLHYNSAEEELGQEAKELFEEAKKLGDSISIVEPRAVDESFFGLTTPEVVIVSDVGEFHAKTLDGKEIDNTIFNEKKLTMVNVWTTWCGACIEEMPDLEALSNEWKDSEVQIMSIVSDTYSSKEGVNQEMLELAQRIVEKTGVTFPTLVPDKHLVDGLLQGILGYPTTFFVDSQGNVIGDSVLGSNTKENWSNIIQERLEEIEK